MSRSAGRSVPAAIVLAAILGACGGDGGSTSGLDGTLVGGDGLTRDEFVETAEALCKETYYERVGADEDIREYTRLIVEDVETIRWTIAEVRALIRHVRGFRQSVNERLRIGREQLGGLYGLEPPDVGRGAVDGFLNGWNEAWLHMRKSAQHMFLGDVDNSKRSWKEARRLSAEANRDAEDFGMGNECISAWSLQPLGRTLRG